MKRYQHVLFSFSAVLLMLVATGCGSEVPIQDSETAVFMPELVGTWHPMAEVEDVDYVKILNFNDKEYYVELREKKADPAEAETLHLRVYVTQIDGQAFINAQPIGLEDEDERQFYFFTLALSPDGVLTLTELQDLDDQQIDKFETSEALYAFIQRNLHNMELYGTSTTFVKAAG